MAIKDVRIAASATPAEIPKRGFYADLEYMYGDGDGYNNVTVGPFPDDKKHLFIAFLNLLEAMLEYEFEDGWDAYGNLPEYARWFDISESDGTPDGDFIYSLRLDTEYEPDDSGCVARLESYGIYYHDGASLDKYELSVVN